MTRCSGGRLAIAAMAAMVTVAGTALADPGVTARRIVIGQSAPLEGPAAALGQDMRTGLVAAFTEANAAGGVSGRGLELVSHDDGYEPGRAAVAAQRLVWDDGVFALVGTAGIAAAMAIQPLAEAAGVPFVGPLSGPAFQPEGTRHAVIVRRATLQDEVEASVERLTTDLGVRRIAILYQDDAFGAAGLAALEKAMEARGLPLVARGSYPRNTVAVKSALLAIRKAKPDAVVMVGVYAPCAEFVRLAHRLAFKPVFVASASVGTRALAEDLGPAGAGVIVSQVVPSPEDASVPLVAAYRAALSKVAPEAVPGFVSLEGYAVGRLVVDALKRLPGEPTREGLLRILGSAGTVEIDGMAVRVGAGAAQGPTEVVFTRIQPDGRVEVVDRLSRSAQ